MCKKNILNFIVTLVLVHTGSVSIFGQTTQPKVVAKKVVVDTIIFKPATSTSILSKPSSKTSSIVSPNYFGGGNGCSIQPISGNTYPSPGVPIVYALYCDLANAQLLHWGITNGYGFDNGDGTVTVYWDYGATQGYIEVDDGSNIIADKTVYINSTQPLNGGSITSSGSTLCSGNGPGTINASSASYGDGSGYSYQWQSSPDGSSWSDISGANGVSYDPGALTSTTYFRRYVSCGSESALTGSIVFYVVYPPSAPGIYADNYTLCSSSSTTLHAPAGGNITWYYSGGGAIGTGATLPNVGVGTYYATASNDNVCGSSSPSNYVTITAGSYASPPNVPDVSGVICNGGSRLLTAYGSGTITWYFNGSPYATGSRLYVSAAGSYRATDNYGCGESGLSATIITITTDVTPSVPSISGVGGILCNGEYRTLSASSNGSILWYKDGSPWSYSSGISTNLGGTYYAVAYNSNCGTSNNSSTVSLSTANSPSVPSISGSGGILCDGASGQLTASSDGSITWYHDGAAFSNASTINPTLAGNYYALAYNPSCGNSDYSITTTFSTANKPSTPSISGSGATLCDGASGQLTASSNGSITWYHDGAFYSNAATINPTLAGNYYAQAYNASCGSSGYSVTNTFYTANKPSTPQITGSGGLLCDGATRSISASSNGTISWYKDGAYYSSNNPLPVSLAGTYYAVANNSSCGNSANSSSVSFTTGNKPGAPVIQAQGLTQLCGNHPSVTLSVVTGSNITWSTGETTSSIVVSNAGTYYARSSNSCGFSDPSQNITVTIGSNPSVNSISVQTGNPNALCKSSSNLVLYNITGGGVWSSSDPTIASISGTTVTGVNPGTATIIYSVSNACGTTSVSLPVTVITVPSVPAITGNNSVCVGSTLALNNPTGGGTWSSDNSYVATVNSSGVVTGLNTGNVNILYTVTNSCGPTTVSKSIAVTTTPALSFISSNLSLCKQGSQTITAGPTSGGTWSSSDPSIATISSSGLVTAQNTVGTATITYTVTNGCGPSSISTTVTVGTVPSVGAISVPTGNKDALCIGTNLVLSNGTPGGIWTSDNASIATVVSGSTVRGVAPGTANILYTVSNTCGPTSVSIPVTVITVPTVAAISGNNSVCVGQTLALNDATGGGTWLTDNSSVATVNSLGVVTGQSTGNANISYTVTNSCGSTTVTKSITVTTTPILNFISSNLSLCKQGSQTITAGPASGGTWSSSNTSIATVSSTGLVTAQNTVGTATITYIVTNGCGPSSISTTVTVGTTPTVGAITVLTGNKDALCVGSDLVLTNATSGGTWSSDNSSVASISSGSTVHGVAGGSANILYTVSNGCGPTTVSIPVTVMAYPTVATITGNSSVCQGSTIALTDATNGGVWSSLSTSIASVNSSGQVTGLSAGDAVIQYSVSNSCGPTNRLFTVSVLNTPSVGNISGVTSLCAGATSLFTNSTPGGSWSSSQNTIASIDANGNVAALSAGITTINYWVTNANGCSAAISKSLTIYADPVVGVISGVQNICTGSNIKLIDATPGGVWSVDQPSLATIGADGTLSGLSAGNVNVRYTVTNENGCSSYQTVAITIYASPVVNPITGSASSCAGTSVSFSNTTPAGVWSSSNAAVATIDNTGLITAMSAGTTQISYTVSNGSGCTSTVVKSFTVNANPMVNSINGVTSVCGTGSSLLTNSTQSGTWSIDNPSIASLTSDGRFTGISNGSALVSYTLTDNNGCSAVATATITVNPVPTIAPITGSSSICISSPSTLADAAPGGLWSSSNPTIATVSSTGLVMGNLTGVTNILYTITAGTGCVAVAALTVTINDVSTTPVISGANAICSGDQAQYTASLSAGVWVSTDTLIATVSNTGLVTGVSGGTTMIAYQVGSGCGAATAIKNLAVNSANLTVTQNLPIGNQVPSATAANRPSAYTNTSTLNYVRTREAIAPISDTSVFRTADYTQVKETTQYIDGIGRPIQTVMKQASPQARDMVSPVVYDVFGREVQKYLPYVSADHSGSFRTDPFSEQAAFMAAEYPGEQVFYGQTQYEPSPLNRVTKTMAPGNSWSGSGRGVGMNYLVNDSTDHVRIWDIGFDSTTNIPVSIRGEYLPGQLFKTLSTDEQGNSTLEYKDKEGHVILKKVQMDCGPINAYTGWLATYYVYDDFGQLRFVMPPKAVQQLASSQSWDPSTQLQQSGIDELCFRYEYDARKRMIAKKVPGAGWVYMVYDMRDRLAYTQDANMRNRNQWMATLYDDKNRPTATGMISYSGTRDALQALLDAQFSAAQSTLLTVSFNAPNQLFVSQRNIGDPVYRAGSVIQFSPGFITENGASFTTLLGPSAITSSEILLNYNPLPPGSVFTALTYHYYDDYAFTTKSYQTSYQTQVDDGGNANPEQLPVNTSLQTKGLPTGTKVRVIEDPNDLTKGSWMESVTYFDDKGRTIQTQSDNYKTGTDISISRYDFSGKVLTSYVVHNNPASSITLKTKTNIVYDVMGRVLSLRKTLNDNNSTTRYLSRNTYNELGQLQQKQLGQKSGSDATAMENQQYAYNIRGWLLGINKDAATNLSAGPATGTGPWFGMQLSYDFGFEHNQYNGNISGVQWSSRGDGEKRAYGFGYDRANRLMFADFRQYTENSWSHGAGIDFTSLMGNGTDYTTAYDANGNILRMQQWGVKLNSSVQIDDLSYDYFVGGNKLKSVFDNANDPQTNLGDFRTSANSPNIGATSAASKTDYGYDSNGNLTKDLNKDIGDATVEGIVYNHLNLPYQVSVKNKGTITYIYDAAGNKLEKRVAETAINKNTKTDYIGGYVYQNDTLQFLAHEEGRIRKDSLGNFLYDYFVKDQLGNTRMVLTDEQQTDAYPAASMETAAAAIENIFYSNIEETRTAKPAGYPDDSYTNPNNFVAKLNGSGNKVGPGIVLRVMSGDQVNIRASSWYNLNGSQTGTPVSPLNDLLTSLSRGIVSSTTNLGKFTATQLQSNGVLNPGINDLLSLQTNSYTNTSRPKAYLNWLLLDEQFKLVSSSSGFEQVGNDNEFKTWVKTGLPINRNGYLYVYTSNESPVDVFFDNLQVSHVRGPLLEETHYYPFGLAMAGISSKAAGKLQNRYKFNDGTELENQEFSDGSGLEIYSTEFRSYDPQIGRFHQQDPLSDFFEDESPYSFAGNNPILNNDPLGLSKEDPYHRLPEVVVHNTPHRPHEKAETVSSSPSSTTAPQSFAGNINSLNISPAGSNEQGSSSTSSGPAPASSGSGDNGNSTAAPLIDEPYKPSSGGSAPNLIPQTSQNSSTNANLYIDNAIKFKGVPYEWGGYSYKGIDCSGLLNRAVGNNNHNWTTSSSGNPIGNWKQIFPSTSSYDRFVGDVQRGDLFLWRGHHTAFYAGDGNLFHAHGRPGTTTGFSNDLRSYWLPTRGYPQVFRQK